MKTQIYNLIILDESGSMHEVAKQTISGCNETINTIRSAQKKYADSQEHFISIFAFQSDGERPSRYLIKNKPIAEAQHITSADYEPYGCTPLNDAVGATLVDLKSFTKEKKNAIGSVTIITDGMENSSEHYTTTQVAMMIQQLKELGWNFNFIGANIDVEGTAASYNIDNAMEFEQDEAGTSAMFECQSKSRMAFYNRVHDVDACYCMEMADSSRVERLKEASKNFFNPQPAEQNTKSGKAKCSPQVRIAPDRIDRLQKDEVFVFGSNMQGNHAGGAARTAVQKFGAIMGQAIGLQGQSYAIPTMHGGPEAIRPYVDEFIHFALSTPQLKFLVTRIGCGIAGFRDEEIAPLFRDALNVDNIYLPQSFVDILTK